MISGYWYGISKGILESPFPIEAQPRSLFTFAESVLIH
jgi:hypothetical protein